MNNRWVQVFILSIPLCAFIFWLKAHEAPMVVPTDVWASVDFIAQRRDLVTFTIPKSPFSTHDHSAVLTASADHVVPWERLQEFETATFREGENLNVQVLRQPPIDWLKANVQYRFETDYPVVVYGLPSKGRLQSVEPKSKYDRVQPTETFGGPSALDPMHILYGGSEICSVSSLVHGHTELDQIQEIESGQLLYQFPDQERYLIIPIPSTLRALMTTDLDRAPYHEVVRVVELKKV